MPYVMVPVPAEHEEEFGHWLLGATLRAKLTAWPDGAVAEILGGAGASTRSALAVVAAGGEYYMGVEEVAAQVGIDPSDLQAQLTEVNERCAAKSWPPLVMLRSEADDDGDIVNSLLMNAPTRSRVLAAFDGD